MAMVEPRSRRMPASDRPSTSQAEHVLARKRMAPEMMRAGGAGLRRRMLRARTDLPQPVSPTMPSVSPAATVRSMPSSTHCNVPSNVSKASR